jgi:hypothetical protein
MVNFRFISDLFLFTSVPSPVRSLGITVHTGGDETARRNIYAMDKI